MSNYTKITRHPQTFGYELAEYCDDYFGPHLFGVKFASDGKVYPFEQVEKKQVYDLWLEDVLNAFGYWVGGSVSDTDKLEFLNQIQYQYKARWERDPLGGEGALEKSRIK